MLRVAHLERLHQGLGRTEATAVLVRLLAPAATVAWQLSANFYVILDKLGQIVRTLLAAVARLFM